jgi:type I restriction enzyme S subunit
VHIPTELQAYVTQAPLVDLLEFGRVEFDAVLSLTVKKSLTVTSQWPTARLADISELRAGKFISANAIKTEFFEGSYPCYGGNGLRGYVKSFTHEGEYSLIGRQGALCGNVFFAQGKFHATEHAVVVTANPNANKKWLHYKLISLDLNQYATGVAQPGLSVERLKDLTFGLPPLNIQQQIVAECEAVDQAVEAAKEKIGQASQAITDGIARIYSDKHPQKRLEELCDIKRGRFSHRPRNDPAFFGGAYPFIQTGDVVRAVGSKVAYT